MHQETQAPPNELMTPEEAADYLRVPVRTIKRAVAERRFPVYKVGRLNRFKRSDLDAYVEKGRIGPSDAAA